MSRSRQCTSPVPVPQCAQVQDGPHAGIGPCATEQWGRLAVHPRARHREQLEAEPEPPGRDMHEAFATDKVRTGTTINLTASCSPASPRTHEQSDPAAV